MTLLFGTVTRYLDDKGFGFIEVSGYQDIFFHIRKIKDESTKQLLSNFDNDTSCAESSELTMWFDNEKTDKGNALAKHWHKINDIPKQQLVDFVNQLKDKFVVNARITQTDIITLKTLILSDVITSTEKSAWIEQLALHTHWQNVEQSQPHWLEEVSYCLLGEEQTLALKRQIQKQKFEARCTKYKENATDIRNDDAMRHVCLNCASDNTDYKIKFADPYKPVTEFVPTYWVSSAQGYQRCQHCGTEWYINHCWSCHSGRVDDRDPATPRCGSCNWCKCEKCQSCSLLGCSTNPYSKDNKFVDAAPKVTSSISAKDFEILF
jgi:cold shock CspA family protein